MGLGLPVLMWLGLSYYVQHWYDNQVMGGVERVTCSDFKGPLKGCYMSGPEWYCRLIYFFTFWFIILINIMTFAAKIGKNETIKLTTQ